MSDFIASILSFLMSLGYFGIALGLMIEVIPSEIVLAYAGYLVSTGNISLVGAIVAGTIGGTIAQIFLYWLGYYGGRPIVKKYGKYVFITENSLNVAENWFQRYGIGVIIIARFIPVVRHAISIPAGLAKMGLARFTFYTVIAIIPWSIIFILIGEQLGKNWSEIENVVGPYMPMVGIGATVVLVGYLLIKIVMNKRKY